MSDDELTPLGRKLIQAVRETREALESGEPLEKRFTVRTVDLDLVEKPFGSDELKAARTRIGASQALFARFLGVSPQTLRGWEQGTRRVPTMAARFIEELETFPEMWSRHVQSTK